jgi:tRNA(fMet)-specific endonuclease VapC
MKYLLDTNMCIYWFKGINGVDHRIESLDIDDVAISAITLAELLYGAYNSSNIEKNLSRIKVFEDAVNVLSLDRECLEQFAKIKSKLKSDGKILDDFDILIGATAIKNDCIIVTNNIKHFERIEGIKIENWIEI